MGEIFERPAPASALEWTGERLTTSVSGQIEIEHLHRYFLARELCRGLDVLDVASGEGYGTVLLAQTAKSAVGVEIAPNAARHAAANYRVPNLRFLEGDARALPLPDTCVDAVVSFETIEHFYEQDAFLAEVKRVLRPGGRLIVSSPDRDVYSPPGQPANPYHARELGRDEFEAVLARHFAHVSMLGQRPMLGSAMLPQQDAGLAPLTFERRGESRYEVSPGLPRSIYLVAIASDDDRVAAPSSVFIERDDVGDVLNHVAAEAAVRAELGSMQARLHAAEAAVAAAREQASMQARANADQFEAASQQVRALDQRLIEQERDWQARLDCVRQEAESRRSADSEAHAAALTRLREAHEAHTRAVRDAAAAHEAALTRLREQHEAAKAETLAARDAAAAHEAVLTRLREEHEAAKAEAVALEAALTRLREEHEAAKAETRVAREEAAAACAQRDLARSGLRRAGVFAENRWRHRVEELEEQLRGFHAAQQERDRMHLATALEMEHWRVRYHVLRGRVELLLRRSGLLPASRMVPRPMRQWVLDAIRRRTRT